MADSSKGMHFSVETVKGKMSTIEGLFGEFAEVLNGINSDIEANVNVGEDSAIFGNYGSKILSTWSENASTFGNFYNNFNNWSALVAAVSANNIELNNDVIALYRTTGNNMDGVAEARKAIASGSSDGLSEDAKGVYEHLIVDSTNPDSDYVPTKQEFIQAKKQGNIPEDMTYEEYCEYMKTGETSKGDSSDTSDTSTETTE